MGRTTESRVFEFFDYDSERNKSICNTCGKELSGKVVTNLKKHLTFHDMGDLISEKDRKPGSESPSEVEYDPQRDVGLKQGSRSRSSRTRPFMSTEAKVDRLERTLEMFQAEMDLKLKIMSEILKTRNEQAEVQKKLIEREQGLYSLLLKHWESNMEDRDEVDHTVLELDRDIDTYKSRDVAVLFEDLVNYSRASKRRNRKRKHSSRWDRVDNLAPSFPPLSDESESMEVEPDFPQAEESDINEDVDVKPEGLTFTEYGNEKRSWVWSYFLRAENGQAALCKLCKDERGVNTVLRTGGGTTTPMHQHLKLHNIVDASSHAGERLKTEPAGAYSKVTSSSKKKSPIWSHYELNVDEKYADCLHCSEKLSRGGTGKGATNTNMINHLKRKHADSYLEYVNAKQAQDDESESVGSASEAEHASITASATSGIKKRSPIWDYFTEFEDTKVICKTCSAVISRSGIGKGATNTTMQNHLKKHTEQYEDLGKKRDLIKAEKDTRVVVNMATASKSKAKPKNPGRKYNSKIWSYYSRVEHHGEPHAQCELCEVEGIFRVFKRADGSTTHLRNHLRSQHDIDVSLNPGKNSGGDAELDPENEDEGLRNPDDPDPEEPGDIETEETGALGELAPNSQFVTPGSEYDEAGLPVSV